MSGSQMNNVAVVWLSCLLFNALVLYPLVMRVYRTGSIVEGLHSDNGEGTVGAIVFGAVLSPVASAVMILMIVIPCFKYLAIIDKALATVADQ